MNKRRSMTPTLPPVNPALEQIARDVLNFETLTPRRRDSLDFKDCGVLGIREALERAFRAGIELGVRESVERTFPVPAALKQAVATAADGPELIARFQVGAADLCQLVRVEQHAEDDFVVINCESCDGEDSPPKVKPFTSSRAALSYALRLATDEVADLITEDLLDS